MLINYHFFIPNLNGSPTSGNLNILAEHGNSQDKKPSSVQSSAFQDENGNYDSSHATFFEHSSEHFPRNGEPPIFKKSPQPQNLIKEVLIPILMLKLPLQYGNISNPHLMEKYAHLFLNHYSLI